MSQILIAEDESRIASFIAKGLRANGFVPTIAVDAQETLNLAIGNNFDLLILDLGLPGKDGLEVLEEIRGQGEGLAVIILTARDDINDKVLGLEGGADDYMTKPFRFEELLARVKLRLRNSQVSQGREEMHLKAGNVVLDLRTRKVQVNVKILIYQLVNLL
jgi:DNA-binding response OmpR family regulator